MILNLTKRPIGKATLDAWGKISDDIAKVAILGIPAIFYKAQSITVLISTVVLLILSAYLFLTVARNVRHAIEIRKE